MKHLTQDELSGLKQKLEEKRAELEEQLSRIGAKDPDTNEWKATYKDVGEEWDDSVHEVQNFSDAASLEESLSKHLEQVTSALTRMEEGTYGLCTVCGEMISAERLMVSPETDRCANHAE